MTSLPSIPEAARPGGAVVTGASSGIGAAIAVELAGRGRRVACVSRRGTVPPAPAAAAGNLVGLSCDVTDAEAFARVVDEFAAGGGISALVNAAGRNAEGPATDLAAADLRAILELNFVAVLGTCRALHPHLRGGGIIINIGSFYDRLGVRGNLAYSASKAALASLTRTLAVEWAADGIAVLNVAPGYVLTPLNEDFFADPEQRRRVERRIPAGRLGTAAEVARLVGSLVTDQVGFLTGSTIYVDGGQGISL